MLVSLIITTFQRDHLLKFTLPTIMNQQIKHDFEVLIVNDGPHGDAERIATDYNCKYIFTGHRNTKHIHWRTPGFAFNIGFKQSQGEVVILSCAEMYHIGDLVNHLVDGVLSNPITNLAIPSGKDDNGDYLRHLRVAGTHSQEIYSTLPPLNTKLPFLMAMSRANYEQIGGYDEDFIGQAFDDDDIVSRLLDYGCSHVNVYARCVHLYHTRKGPGRSRRLHEYNRKLYEARKGIIMRNVGREWGRNNVTTA